MKKALLSLCCSAVMVGFIALLYFVPVLFVLFVVGSLLFLSVGVRPA